MIDIIGHFSRPRRAQLLIEEAAASSVVSRYFTCAGWGIRVGKYYEFTALIFLASVAYLM